MSCPPVINSSPLPSVLSYFFIFIFFTVQLQSQARGDLRGAAAIHTQRNHGYCPVLLSSPFKTQPALFTAAVSISRLTARTPISRAAAAPLAVSSCQARQRGGQRLLHMCTFRWLRVAVIEGDVPSACFFAVDVSWPEINYEQLSRCTSTESV